jgi:ubiquinone biosynthesis protein
MPPASPAPLLTASGAAPGADRAAFTRDMGEALEQYYAVAAAQAPSFAEIVNQFSRLGQRYKLRILRQFLFAFRAFIIVESVARDLDARFNMLATLQAFTPHLLARQFLPDMTEAFPGAYRALFTLRRALTRLPVSLTRALQQLAKGELTVTVANAPMEEIPQHLDRASNRLSLSLIIAAVIIGSSLVMAVHTGPHYLGIPLLGLLGYSVASAFGLWWVTAILRSGKF